MHTVMPDLYDAQAVSVWGSRQMLSGFICASAVEEGSRRSC